MNILFLFVSLPHLDNDSAIFTSLIHEFRKNGHNVKVVTKDRTGEPTRLVTENGIDVIRINGLDFTGVSGNVKKALGYMEYTYKLERYVKEYFRHEKFDLIFSHSLPPEIAWAAGRLKRYYRCQFYLLQTDFIWQDAVAFGYFSKYGPIALYYRYWETRLFKTADYIGCPTEGNIDFIKSNYPKLSISKFRFLPFWQKELPVPEISDRKSMAGLGGKFVVVYGGSIGAAQRIERIIDLADSCREYEDMAFVIIGRGAYLPVIRQMAEDRHLKNVVFKEFMPQEEYLKFLASCDVGMIILHEKMATPNFPSKALSYLNMKVPILAALDRTTDFGDYLAGNNAGLWGYSDDIPALKRQLLKYYNSKGLCAQVKECAYKLFVENLTPECAYHRIMKDVKNE